MDFNIQQKNQDAINGVIRAVHNNLNPAKTPRMEYFRTLSFLPMMTEPNIPQGPLKERFIYTKIGNDFVKIPDFRYLAQEDKRRSIHREFCREADFEFLQKLNIAAINDIKSGKAFPFFMGMFHALPEKKPTGLEIISLALKKLKESNRTNNEAEHSEAMQILNKTLEKLKEAQKANTKPEKAKVKNLNPSRGERKLAKHKKYLETLYRKQNSGKITMEEYKKSVQEALDASRPKPGLFKRGINAVKKFTGKLLPKINLFKSREKSIKIFSPDLFKSVQKVARKAARTALSKAALL